MTRTAGTEWIRAHPRVTLVVGALTTGVGALGGAVFLGLPSADAVVVGLALATPATNLGPARGGFERDRYLAEADLRRLVVDGVVSAVLALIIGLVAVVSGVAWQFPGGLLILLGALGAVVGGTAGFVARTLPYREFDPGTDPAPGSPESPADDPDDHSSGSEAGLGTGTGDRADDPEPASDPDPDPESPGDAGRETTSGETSSTGES